MKKAPRRNAPKSVKRSPLPEGGFVVPSSFLAILGDGNVVAGRRFLQEMLAEGPPKSVTEEVELALAVEREWGEPEKAPKQDEREVQRAFLRSQCNNLKQKYSSRSNPIHIWEAIVLCTDPRVAPMLLPDWCIRYLNEVARDLLEAVAAGYQGGPLKVAISQAIKFSRRGSNAVKDLASERAARRLALMYDEYCCDGMSPAKATEKLAESPPRDIGGVSKQVKKGHDYLRR